MAFSPDPPASPPDGTSTLVTLRTFFLRSVPGYLILGGVALKLIYLAAIAASLPATDGLQAVSGLGGLALVGGTGVVVFRLAQVARRRILWRVRRKLIVSYLLIGLVPAVLLVTFFVLCGLLLFANLSSYLIRTSLTTMATHASYLARSAATDVERATGAGDLEALLERRRVTSAVDYPGASFAVVPIDVTRCASPTSKPVAEALRSARSGDWAHVSPPVRVPEWVTCAGFAGTLVYHAGDPPAEGGAEPQLLVRAIALPEHAAGYAVLVDIPVADVARRRIEQATGIALGSASLPEEDRGAALRGRLHVRPVPVRTSTGLAAGVPAVAVLDIFDWQTGGVHPLTMQVGMNVRGIYHQMSVQLSFDQATFGDRLIIGLLIVLTLFLIIEFVAAVAGMALARSITGSVHELFAGTERVRQGDFGHRIAVLAKDQLGELAESFNSMTASIEDLLRQAAEKKRLEEEMRLAREIQTSLLPSGPLQIPGMRVVAVCVPAREVGGDYYDVITLPDGRVGVLIADVSGKGMSAALYMAELKGLILSLCEIHPSPRDLLIAANRLISEHLDSRSFITMTYAVIDPRSRVMTYARAGHTPMMYVPAAAPRMAETLTPDGMVLGLRLDNGERFTSLLVEASLALAPGDRLVFFTDGISEAMNDEADCFGETRLARLLEEHADLPLDELRERIIREIDAFVGGAPQHDDMTLILLDVGDAVEVGNGHA